LAATMTDLFDKIWTVESVPKDFRDATIVHLYKRKGNRAVSDNHRGISLLATAGKLLTSVAESYLPRCFLKVSVDSALTEELST
jgi:hypothetical protein